VPTFFKETAMQDDRSNDERQRDYEQIKQDLMRRGRGVAEAEASPRAPFHGSALKRKALTTDLTDLTGLRPQPKPRVHPRRNAGRQSAATASCMPKPDRAASPAARR
jgi:hypothetical protein